MTLRKSFNGHVIETAQRPKRSGTITPWGGGKAGSGDVVICVDLRNHQGYFVLHGDVQTFFDKLDPPPDWIVQKEKEHNAKMARGLLEMLKNKNKKS